MITYDPLWVTMAEKNVTTYALIHKHGISAHTIYNLKHNMGINTYTLNKLCNILDCTPNDVLRFERDY